MINPNDTGIDVYMWDVGHGLSITVITPYVTTAMGVPIYRRRVIQVDAGSNTAYGFSPISHLVNNHLIDTIDWLIISHPDKDHIDDLPNILNLQKQNKLKVLTLMRNITIPDAHISEDPSDEHLSKTAYKHYNSTYIGSVPNEHLLTPDNFGGLEVQTTFLPYMMNNDFNNASIQVSIKFGSTQILIPGDLEEEGTGRLIENGQLPNPDFNCYRILIAPHHGSSTAKPGKLLKHFKPHKVLASVEENHELTDPIYSSADYVIGHPITTSSGVEETRRFTGTKGELIHLHTYGDYPILKKVSYKQYLRTQSPALSALEQILKMSRG